MTFKAPPESSRQRRMRSKNNNTQIRTRWTTHSDSRYVKRLSLPSPSCNLPQKRTRGIKSALTSSLRESAHVRPRAPMEQYPTLQKIFQSITTHYLRVQNVACRRARINSSFHFLMPTNVTGIAIQKGKEKRKKGRRKTNKKDKKWNLLLIIHFFFDPCRQGTEQSIKKKNFSE